MQLVLMVLEMKHHSKCHHSESLHSRDVMVQPGAEMVNLLVAVRVLGGQGV